MIHLNLGAGSRSDIGGAPCYSPEGSKRAPGGVAWETTSVAASSRPSEAAEASRISVLSAGVRRPSATPAWRRCQISRVHLRQLSIRNGGRLTAASTTRSSSSFSNGLAITPEKPAAWLQELRFSLASSVAPREAENMMTGTGVGSVLIQAASAHDSP